MKLMKSKVAIVAMTLFAGVAQAEVAVVVHPSNSASLDQSNVARIFLGKMKSFPGAGQAVPLNQSESNAATAEFNSKVLKKSGSQLKAYWSKLVFTGKGTPPKAIASDAEVIKLVSTNPNMIGYVDSSAVTGNVKVVGKF